MPPGVRVPGSTGKDRSRKPSCLQLSLSGGRLPGSVGKKSDAGHLLRMRLNDSKLSLLSTLNKRNQVSLSCLIADKHPYLLSPVPRSWLLPPGRVRHEAKTPLHLAFGPFTVDEALQTLKQVEEKPGLLDELLRFRVTESEVYPRSFWLIYTNDGAPPFNPGFGSDQGPTAKLALALTFDSKRTGLTKVGVTAIEMVTPHGVLPQGAAFHPESTYQTSGGPYSGIISFDFEVTVERTGTLKVDVLGRVGVDNQKWGKFVQDSIHQQVSNSPLFPWPADRTKPFVETGLQVRKLTDLTKEGEVLGISYTGRLEVDAKATVGTHRAEGTLGAKWVMRSASIKTAAGVFNLEYSPVGLVGRGFVRYNDGREEGFAGVEGGVTSNLSINLGRFGLGLAAEALMSTDPALQTDNPVGSHPILPTPGMPRGFHGTGTLFLRVRF